MKHKIDLIRWLDKAKLPEYVERVEPCMVMIAIKDLFALGNVAYRHDGIDFLFCLISKFSEVVRIHQGTVMVDCREEDEKIKE